MVTKRFLILMPMLVMVFLFQSYLWVPTYEEQTTGNPDRLYQYITPSLGDATSLNPIISSNSTSSQIESLVFEGLLDRDEELRFRGRVARSWDIFEEAYFYVNSGAPVPAAGFVDGPGIVQFIETAKKKADSLPPEVRETLRRIQKIVLIPPEERSVVKALKSPSGNQPVRKIRVHIQAPARIKMTLAEINQDLFTNLSRLLGEDYFTSFDPVPFVRADPSVDRQLLARWAGELLPVTEHNPVIVFHLRPDVRFHDGRILTAEDVRFTYQAVMDPANLSPRVSDYEPVKTVEVVDPLTLRIVYKRLYSPALATWGMGILPKHLLNREALRKEARMLGRDPDTFTMRQSRFDRHPVGCGPFQFDRWESDQFILLKRFNGYWEGPPNYHRYVMRIIPDLLTQEMEFYSGTLDSYQVQPHQVKRLEKDPRFQCFSGTSFGYTYIGYNLRRAPFDDVRVRRALGMAINVDHIISYVLYHQGERITGPFAVQTDYYDHRIPPLPYDPEGAVELLNQAGWKRNEDGWMEKDGKRLEFTLITNSGNDIRKAILAIAQDAWKQIGIDVRTDVLEWSVFIQERVNKLDFDALVLGWVMGIEPDLYQIWHSSQTHPHQLNFVGFQNLKADELIIKIRQEYDHAKQVAYCHELHRLIAQEQPCTFLYVGKWTAVLDRRIVIKDLDQNGLMLYKKITPTKTGDYTFHFNKWIKLAEMPQFSEE
ncbi:MAG: peptide ABC transporter substrate-binding protein [Desulfococcus sp. 4484_242]|nr:MAG: peptide ABC transporter substrate-binding protein [Desulfococcus sp. 4484_242]